MRVPIIAILGAYACSDNLRIGLRWLGTYMSSNSVRYVRDRGSTTRVNLKSAFRACLTCNYLSVLHIPYHSTSPLPILINLEPNVHPYHSIPRRLSSFPQRKFSFSSEEHKNLTTGNSRRTPTWRRPYI